MPSDREHGHGLGEVRTDQREIGPRGRPPVGEPPRDVGVAVAEGVPDHEVGHQRAERERARGEDEEAQKTHGCGDHERMDMVIRARACPPVVHTKGFTGVDTR